MAAAGGRGARGKNGAPSRPPRRRSAPAPQAPSTQAAPAPLGAFRLGAVPGATPGKWIDTWRQRMPHNRLELVPLSLADQREAVLKASVDAAIVRGPIDRAGLHLIPLYEEIPVVVCAADSHLTVADALTCADLAGEVLIVPMDAPVQAEVPGVLAPRFAAPATVAEAIEIVAAGVGVVIVPASLARAHRRKDVAARPLADAPTSPVALAWPVGQTAPLVDAFIGIVRGRTANSSR